VGQSGGAAGMCFFPGAVVGHVALTFVVLSHAIWAHAPYTPYRSDVDACIKSGMDRYLSKPINLHDIRDLLLQDLEAGGGIA